MNYFKLITRNPLPDGVTADVVSRKSAQWFFMFDDSTAVQALARALLRIDHLAGLLRAEKSSFRLSVWSDPDGSWKAADSIPVISRPWGDGEDLEAVA